MGYLFEVYYGIWDSFSVRGVDSVMLCVEYLVIMLGLGLGCLDY